MTLPSCLDSGAKRADGLGDWGLRLRTAQNIQAFYPPGSLEPLAQRIAQSGALNTVAGQWRLPMEIAMDLCKLALFDTVLYVRLSSCSRGTRRIQHH